MLEKKGFTLVEVMAASMIAAFIAVVAVSTLKAVSMSASVVESDMETADTLRFALSMVQRDLLNFYRDGSGENTRLVGSVAEGSENISSMITFYTAARSRARVNEPEGDVYEVEYFLLRSEEKSALARRVWPNPDNLLPVGFEQRGVLTVIADDIEVFEIRYFDGEMWQIDWPEELTELPELIEVSMAAASKGGRAAAGSFTVNFVRGGGRLQSDIEGAQEGQAGEQSDIEQQPQSRDESTTEVQSDEGGRGRSQSGGQNQGGRSESQSNRQGQGGRSSSERTGRGQSQNQGQSQQQGRTEGGSRSR